MTLIIKICLVGFLSIHSASANQITIIEHVEVLNGNLDEAKYYYQHNWLELRKKAVKNDIIKSYQLLEVKEEDGLPAKIILITTYKNQAQFDMAEDNFVSLIEEMDGLKLLNEKQPGDFRKTTEVYTTRSF